MRFVLLLTLLMLPQQPSRSLASLVDTNRVLLVFAPSDDDTRFARQLALLHGHAAEMKDRDLVLVVNLVKGAAPAPYAADSDQLATRHRFHIASDAFAAILLGKDGDEKLRAATPIAIEQLDRTIDAMPMRQQEMKEKQASSGRPPSSR
jgi:hypothetical protein